MPSLDFFKSAPATEQLRIESEPPGADARTSQGQTCRTPCELTVPGGAEMTVTVAMAGYQPQTLPVRPESADGSSSNGRLEPNPVYVELMAATPAKPGKKPVAKKRTTAAVKPPPTTTSQNQAAAPTATSAGGFPTSNAGGYPWPPAPQ